MLNSLNIGDMMGNQYHTVMSGPQKDIYKMAKTFK